MPHVNPYSGEPIADKETDEYVGKLLQVRTSARKDARSGNPAKAAAGREAAASSTRLLRLVYANEAGAE